MTDDVKYWAKFKYEHIFLQYQFFCKNENYAELKCIILDRW